MPNATGNGIPTRKIIVVPCIVKMVLYCDAVSTVPFGPASWSLISRASMPAIRKKMIAVPP